MKITFMGAGSTIFARNVLGDCMLTEALRDGVYALYDIDATRLEESRVMFETMKKTVCVNAVTSDQAEEIVSRGYINGDYILDENGLVKRATIVAVRKIDTPAE